MCGFEAEVEVEGGVGVTAGAVTGEEAGAAGAAGADADWVGGAAGAAGVEDAVVEDAAPAIDGRCFFTWPGGP